MGVFVIRRLLPFLLPFAVFAQTELSHQIELVKEIMPQATRLGIFYNTKDNLAASMISRASQETEMTIVRAPVTSIREMATGMRLLKKHDVDFFIIFNDRVTGGPSALKFVVKQTVKNKKPVFTSSENAFKSGVFGKFIKKDANWSIQINGKVQSLFDISIPNNDHYAVINEG